MQSSFLNLILYYISLYENLVFIKLIEIMTTWRQDVCIYINKRQ